MVAGPTHTNLIFDVVVPQGYKVSDDEISAEIARRINRKWSNYYAVIKMEKRYIESYEKEAPKLGLLFMKGNW